MADAVRLHPADVALRLLDLERRAAAAGDENEAELLRAGAAAAGALAMVPVMNRRGRSTATLYHSLALLRRGLALMGLAPRHRTWGAAAEALRELAPVDAVKRFRHPQAPPAQEVDAPPPPAARPVTEPRGELETLPVEQPRLQVEAEPEMHDLGAQPEHPTGNVTSCPEVETAPASTEIPTGFRAPLERSSPSPLPVGTAGRPAPKAPPPARAAAASVDRTLW